MPLIPKFQSAPDIRERLLDALRIGSYREEACEYAGIDNRTFTRWMERGHRQQAADHAYEMQRAEWETSKKGREPKPPDQEDAPYAVLAQEVKRAEADARIAAVAAVHAAFSQPNGKGWIAAMTYLERKDPSKWGRRDRTTHVNLDVPAGDNAVGTLDLRALLEHLDEETLAKIHDAAARATAKGNATGHRASPSGKTPGPIH